MTDMLTLASYAVACPWDGTAMVDVDDDHVLCPSDTCPWYRRFGTRHEEVR
jgi:hypothetical protein